MIVKHPNILTMLLFHRPLEAESMRYLLTFVRDKLYTVLLARSDDVCMV